MTEAFELSSVNGVLIRTLASTIELIVDNNIAITSRYETAVLENSDLIDTPPQIYDSKYHSRFI